MITGTRGTFIHGDTRQIVNFINARVTKLRMAVLKQYKAFEDLKWTTKRRVVPKSVSGLRCCCFMLRSRVSELLAQFAVYSYF